MRVAIVTVITGGYDPPKPIAEQDIDVITMLVSDDPKTTADGWNRGVVIPPGDDRRVAAKGPKLRPWDYLAGPYGAWIYIDGSFEVTSSAFAREVVELTVGPLGQFHHPQRDCIYEEAAFTKQWARKYDDVPVIDQAAHYATTGHPRGWGMWNTGLIVYREPLPYLADLWEAEIGRWGPQCQISQPVALRRAGLRPTTLPGVVYDAPWMTHHAHNDGTR